MVDKVRIPLANYQDRTGSRVMPGRYLVMVEDLDAEQAKTSGNTMITVSLRVLGGEFDGSIIVDRLVISEKSLFRVVGFLQGVGAPTPKKDFDLNLSTLRGRKVEVDVEDGEPYRGRIKSEVRGYMRVMAGPQAVPADLNGDGLDEFAPAPEERAEATEKLQRGLADQADVEDLTESDDEIDLDKIEL